MRLFRNYKRLLPLGEPPTMIGAMGREGSLETLGGLMRRLRVSARESLTSAARAAEVDKGHLSHVERGRDRPSWNLIAFYEERYQADGQLWSVYVEVCTTPNRNGVKLSRLGVAYPVSGDASSFVADITVPDGTIMPPEFAFEKIWCIANVGTVPWKGRWLARDGAPAGHGIPSSPTRVPIADTSPGGSVEISVPMTSQPLAGTSQVRWKMVDDRGFEYFPDRYSQGLCMTIVVRADAPAPVLRRLLP